MTTLGSNSSMIDRTGEWLSQIGTDSAHARDGHLMSAIDTQNRIVLAEIPGEIAAQEAADAGDKDFIFFGFGVHIGLLWDIIHGPARLFDRVIVRDLVDQLPQLLDGQPLVIGIGGIPEVLRAALTAAFFTVDQKIFCSRALGCTI